MRLSSLVDQPANYGSPAAAPASASPFQGTHAASAGGDSTVDIPSLGTPDALLSPTPNSRTVALPSLLPRERPRLTSHEGSTPVAASEAVDTSPCGPLDGVDSPNDALMLQNFESQPVTGDSTAYTSAEVLHSPRVLTAVTTIQAAYRGYKARRDRKFQVLLSHQQLDRIRHVREVRARFREIGCFLAFLTILTASTSLVFQDQDIFNLGRSVDEAIFLEEFEADDSPQMYKAFADIATIPEFYQWLEGPFYNALYTDATWGGESEATYPGSLFGASDVIGCVRLTQLRVKSRACTRGPASDMNYAFDDTGSSSPTCYGDEDGGYSPSTESTDPFGGSATHNVPPFMFDGTGWLLNEEYSSSLAPPREWLSSGFEGSRTSWGRVFPAAGFSVMLPNHNGTLAREVIAKLKTGQYIDLATRLVVVDLSAYNPMMDMWVGARAFIELPKSGGVVVSYQLTPVRLYSWTESDILSNLLLEVVIAVFYAGFIAHSILSMKHHGCRGRCRLHTVMHELNSTAYVVMWVLRLTSYALLPDATSINVRSNRFYDYTMPIALKATSVHMASMNIFLAWFRALLFLSRVPRYGLVTGTLRRASGPLAGFLVVFFVLLFGFAQAHMLVFGTRLRSFRNLTTSALTLLRSLVGDVDLDDLVEAQWLMGVVFFLCFVGIIWTFSINILVAIVSDAYQEETEELASSRDVRIYHEMVAYLVHLSRENRLLKATLRCCGLGRNIKRIGTVFAMKARHRRRSLLEEPPFEDLVDTVVDDDADQGAGFPRPNPRRRRRSRTQRNRAAASSDARDDVYRYPRRRSSAVTDRTSRSGTRTVWNESGFDAETPSAPVAPAVAALRDANGQRRGNARSSNATASSVPEFSVSSHRGSVSSDQGARRYRARGSGLAVNIPSGGSDRARRVPGRLGELLGGQLLQRSGSSPGAIRVHAVHRGASAALSEVENAPVHVHDADGDVIRRMGIRSMASAGWLARGAQRWRKHVRVHK